MDARRTGWRFWLAEAGVVFVLLLLAWQAVYGIAAVKEPDVADEQTSIVYASTGHQPNASMQPLYAHWYRLLLAVEPDRARVGALNWSVLAALVVLSLYTACRSLGAGRLAAQEWLLTKRQTCRCREWPMGLHMFSGTRVSCIWRTRARSVDSA